MGVNCHAALLTVALVTCISSVLLELCFLHRQGTFSRQVYLYQSLFEYASAYGPDRPRASET